MRSARFFYLWIIVAIGFSSLIYEVYSTKVLFFFVPNSNYAITIALSAFLSGLGISSLFFSRFSSHNRKKITLIVTITQVLAACYAFFILKNYLLLPDVFNSIAGLSAFSEISKFVLVWLYLFIPAFFLGCAFPLVNGLYLASKEEGARDTSLVYFYDLMGSVLGAMLTGFIFLPYFGFTFTIMIALTVNLCVAISLVSGKKNKTGISLLLGLFLALYLLFDLFSITNFFQDLKLQKRFGTVLFQKESPFGRITISQNSFGRMGNKTLFINYRDMCHEDHHESETDIGTNATVGLKPNSKVLNIGLGCGFTAESVLQSKNVSHLDVVEINPVVIEGSKAYFLIDNPDVFVASRTKIINKDGAEFVRDTKNKYDAIVIDVEEPTIIYSSPLYTKEYFAYMKSRLNTNGVLVLWANNGSPEFGKIIYNTLKTSFEYVHLKILKNSYYFTYYASLDPDYALTDQENIDTDSINMVLTSPVKDINTLDRRSIEKYFDINSFFNLPSSYSEKFFDKSKR